MFTDYYGPNLASPLLAHKILSNTMFNELGRNVTLFESIKGACDVYTTLDTTGNLSNK